MKYKYSETKNIFGQLCQLAFDSLLPYTRRSVSASDRHHQVKKSRANKPCKTELLFLPSEVCVVSRSEFVSVNICESTSTLAALKLIGISFLSQN